MTNITGSGITYSLNIGQDNMCLTMTLMINIKIIN